MPVVDISLPPLHEGRKNSGGQLAIIKHPARFKVIVCGRRWGKTTLGVYACVKTALQGGRTWWVAPTYKIANEGWMMLRTIALQIPRAEIKEGDRVVKFPDAGEMAMVEIRSADTVGGLRGAGLDGLVFDEFPQSRESAWTEELRATLSDNQGWAIFIGTPRGKNWAWNLFQRAKLADNWESWSIPSIDNPYIEPSEIDAARDDLPDAIFRQEYEADFGASQLQVYPEFDRQFHIWKWDLPKFDHFFGGLDFGGTSIGSHKSAGVLAGYDSKTDTLVLLNEFEQSGANIAERQLTWMGETQANLSMMQKKNRHRLAPFTWRADKTQMAFIQVVRNAGYQVLPSKGGTNSVQNGIGLVQRRLKTRGDGRARLYYTPDLTFFPDAMERYRYPDFSEFETKPQSKNPLKVQDDTADAIRYLIEGIDQMVIGDPNVLYKNALGRIR